ncbi:transmembrane and immunoglobulin domain-containing protein 2 [Hippopotamus amphibius kiboko]|uniref:transmembrane and immunoglobulin domain-containing protein 2 n=1 Tax=Hippopotamus amphibius kiboko TaxID=575201 RepID=UPI0025974675|nr:transmembrane and immunoglobulin domain-containing protein 2 [Hippopotamus amphibius kiboko]
MGSLGMVLVLLVQFWALQGATGLSVQQAPKLLQVRQDSQVTLTCQVVQAQAWERLLVEWTKDGGVLCQTNIINGSLSVVACGPRGRLSWRPPGNLTLQLDRVSLNDSGLYLCLATLEIPDLEEARGNGTQLLVETDGWLQNPSFSGLSIALLVTGAVAAAAFALGAGIWGRHRCRNRDAGNPLYSNVLYRPRRAPRKSEAWPVEGKALDIPGKNPKAQSFYSISFPRPPTPKPHLAPKSCPSPRPSHPIAAAGVSPGPGSSGQARPRGFLEVGRGLRTPRDPERTPPGAI